MEEIKGVVNGVVHFTNWTDEDFTTKWDSVIYTFPANKTSPMIISNATPEQVLKIRIKFARDLAEKMFFSSERFKKMNNIPMGGTPALYTEAELLPFTQKCLEPLPVAPVKTKKIVKDDTDKLSRDSKGKLNTKVLEDGESLVGNGTVIA